MVEGLGMFEGLEATGEEEERYGLASIFPWRESELTHKIVANNWTGG